MEEEFQSTFKQILPGYHKEDIFSKSSVMDEILNAF